ncbi:hypothetical protein MNEG_15949, partial [Monoraphidium neglectum]
LLRGWLRGGPRHRRAAAGGGALHAARPAAGGAVLRRPSVAGHQRRQHVLAVLHLAGGQPVQHVCGRQDVGAAARQTGARAQLL